MRSGDEIRDTLKYYGFLGSMAGYMVKTQLRKGTLLETIRLTVKNRALTVAKAFLLGDIQEEKARKNGDRTYLRYKDMKFSYREMDENSNRVANGLISVGVRPPQGVAIMMRNCPRFLDAFYATQKTGMYAVPVNVSLKGDQLVHTLENSEASAMVIDHKSWEAFQAVRDRLPRIEQVVLDMSEAPDDFEPGGDFMDMDSFYGPEVPTTRPAERPVRGEVAVLMYTSGTTGLPKGTVWKYGDTRIEMIGMLAHYAFTEDDNLFTCAPLFHANALFISGLTAMYADAQFSISQKFSARGLLDELIEYEATSFNAMGSLMEIVMMQPPSEKDRQHRVRLVMAAALTPETWKKFEDRYGIKLWNAYGAVDSGNGIIINAGTAPPGSLGRPMGVKCRVVKEDGGIAAPGEQGELQMYLGKSRPVEYFRNDEATEEKVVDGWVRTGDIVMKDRCGNYYFMGRDIERMRRRGENITCFDVEKEIMAFEAVEEVAVYGVPSELGEDEVMAAVVPREGMSVEPVELVEFLGDRLAAFQMPRFVRLMDELPKTEIWKVKKKELQQEGVTGDTWDMTKDGVRHDSSQ
ncbi:MAG: AMP-binding protein [Actinobacteria bacterium]|nr:AMP-binding protein [Actinomycetota bacterium]MBU1942148.1 AMP-binding protein [Actinomycetota bacterium]MBU2688755.1 AMP-binding protein [Actinomycetota bacterium]